MAQLGLGIMWHSWGLGSCGTVGAWDRVGQVVVMWDVRYGRTRIPTSFGFYQPPQGHCSPHSFNDFPSDALHDHGESGAAMDVEFVVKRNEAATATPTPGATTIYIVQRRPLDLAKKDSKPSYFAEEFLNLKASTRGFELEGNMLTALQTPLLGAAEVTNINHKNEIIIRNDAAAAWSAYLGATQPQEAGAAPDAPNLVVVAML